MNQTKNTEQANAILEDMKRYMDGKSHVLTHGVENPDAVRQSIYKRVGNFFPKSLITIRSVPEYRDNLIVNIKEEPTVVKYERLLREALGHIDNEKLYEEILNAITITI